MSVFEQLIQSNNRESIWIDYKMKIDFVGNRIDFLRDVIAFANNSFEGHQYISMVLRDRWTLELTV
jgi:hypothetical protein